MATTVLDRVTPSPIFIAGAQTGGISDIISIVMMVMMMSIMMPMMEGLD
jgi:hypothetical protein